MSMYLLRSRCSVNLKVEEGYCQSPGSTQGWVHMTTGKTIYMVSSFSPLAGKEPLKGRDGSLHNLGLTGGENPRIGPQDVASRKEVAG